MRKEFSVKYNINIVTLFAGELYACKSSDAITTVLGSCVAVCIYDKINGVRGMNHFMLPDSSNKRKDFSLRGEDLEAKDLRFGIASMESLIAAVQKQGGDRKNFRAKIFGGGNVLQHGSVNHTTVGEKNIGFARAFLRSERIPVESENIGGDFGRKIFFLEKNYSIFLKKVNMDEAVAQENKFLKQINNLKDDTDITVF